MNLDKILALCKENSYHYRVEGKKPTVDLVGEVHISQYLDF